MERLQSQAVVHELKTWPEYFDAIVDGRKRFEVRYNDRNFKVGDILVLREFDPMHGRYTGAERSMRVTYALDLGVFTGLYEDYLVMGIEDVVDTTTGDFT